MKPEDQKAFEDALPKIFGPPISTMYEQYNTHIAAQAWQSALAHRDAQPAVAVNENELCPSCRNSDIYACTCPFPSALNHTPDTGKMVRLTEIELWRNDELMALNAEFGLLFPDVKRFANAIMDAMIAKNGGQG